MIRGETVYTQRHIQVPKSKAETEIYMGEKSIKKHTKLMFDDYIKLQAEIINGK